MVKISIILIINIAFINSSNYLKPVLEQPISGVPGWLSQFSTQLLILAHGLAVPEMEPPDGKKPAWDNLSPSLSAPTLLARVLSLKRNKHLEK